MQYSFDKTARVARQWAERPALSESNRTLCLIVSAMAESLSEAMHVATEDLDSFIFLGCELCRRLGEAECLQPAECLQSVRPDILANGCPLGLAASMDLASPACHGLQSGLRHCA